MLSEIDAPLSLTEIAGIVSLAKTSVERRKGIENYFVGNYLPDKGTGRPVRKYSPAVLSELFHINMGVNNNMIIENARAERDDKAVPRKPEGWARQDKIDLDIKIKNLAFAFYLETVNPRDVMDSVRMACQAVINELGEIPPGFKNDLHQMAWFYYQKRIMRGSPGSGEKVYKGWFHAESWREKHKYKWDKHAIQKDLAKNRWDYVSLYMDLGLIGHGYGAGQAWFIDGTAFDAYLDVSQNGKPQPVRVNFMVVRCALTGMPIAIEPIASESTYTVIRALAQAYERVGVPSLGIFGDNSSAFKSNEVQGFIKSLYSGEQLNGFSGGYDWVRKFFPDQPKAPAFLPLPYIPTFPFKAKGERAFQDFNNYIQRAHASSWQASRDRRSKPILCNTPVPIMKNALSAEQSWEDFVNWIYNNYVNNPKPIALKSFSAAAKRAGLKREECVPTIANAWRFFGGLDEGGIANPQKFPEENESLLYYYLTPDTARTKHRTRQKSLGGVAVTHDNILRNYSCPELGVQFTGVKELVVIPKWDEPERAFIYVERDPVFAKEGVYFVGEGLDMTLRNRDDYDKIAINRANRTRQLRDLEEAVENAVDVSEYKVLPEPSRFEPEEKLSLPSTVPVAKPKGIPAPSKDIHDNIEINIEFEQVKHFVESNDMLADFDDFDDEYPEEDIEYTLDF